MVRTADGRSEPHARLHPRASEVAQATEATPQRSGVRLRPQEAQGNRTARGGHGSRSLRGEGWTVERLGKPYDLHCTRGGEERRVEVKGTTGAATSVDLTINEVEHARNPQNTVDLFVVSDIKVDMRTGDYTTSGGRVLHLHDWAPADEDLRPRSFEYRLPLS
ncbi:protein NO VEIN domain-containing protein [Streptomyces malaysiensis subsp. malaysiensis]